MAKIRNLRCAICGESAGRWQQWWNQDTGYGICPRHANAERGRMDAQQMRDSWGVPWINFAYLPPAEDTK